MDFKRKGNDMELVPAKKPKNEVALHDNNLSVLAKSGINRTSSLAAPIMLLTGHEGEIFTTRFSPNGDILASAGKERLIFLWNTYGECENYAVLKGHTGSIMQLVFHSEGTRLATASTDKTVGVWDVEVGVRVKRFKGHQGFVNSCDMSRRGPQYVCSGGDDCSVKMWDVRQKGAVQTFNSTYQLTSIGFTDTAEQIISGGIDNQLKVWDLRKTDMIYEMQGHTDTITGVRLSPDGSYLLTAAMDNTVRIWDVRPYAPQERCVKIFTGNQHTFEKNLLRVNWSADGSKITAGSGDRFVYIWDTTTRRVLYKLPGHAGSVNEIDFHPTEPIIVSGSSDKRLYLGEIEVSS